MQSNTVEFKIIVFISSKCGGQYTIVRKALKTLLVETGLTIVYLFETASASSESMPSAYLKKIDESHLCVFLIDNKDNVTPAVLSEYKRAKELKKRILFVFCDERKKISTELQKEIETNRSLRYSVVNKFSDFTEKAYKSVIDDIVDRYKPTHDIISSDEDITNTIEIEAKEMLSTDNFIINKTMLEGFDKTKKELLNNFFTYSNNAEVEDTSELDNLSKDFINVILCNKKFKDIDFQAIRKEVIALHEPTYQDIISLRLKAVEYYFNDQPVECMDKLQEALQKTSSNTEIANWISNDIALDLGHRQSVEAQKNGEFPLSNEGYDYINRNQEMIFFPCIDRITTNLNDIIIKNYFQLYTDSPDTGRIKGNGIFTKIAECFCIAMIYGSITHMNLIRNYIIDALFSLWYEYNNYEQFTQLIKMLIIEMREKDIQNLTRICTQSENILNSNDIEDIQKSIECIPSSTYRMRAQFILFKFFGYYFSDEQYEKTTTMLFDFAYTCIQDNTNRYGDSFIIDAFIDNWKRVDNDKVGCLMVKLMEKPYFWFDKTNAITDFSHMQEEMQSEIMNKIIDIISQSEAIKNKNYISNYLHNFLIYFRLTARVDFQRLDETVKEYMNEFFETDYHFEIFTKKKQSCVHHIMYYVESIHRNIKEQEENHIFTNEISGFYVTILNILTKNKLSLSCTEIQLILESVKKTLLSPYQDYKGKCSAITLIVFFKNHFSYGAEWNEYIDFIKEQQEQILGSNYPESSFMKTSTRGTLFFYYSLMLHMFKKQDLDEVINLILNIPNISDLEKIERLKFIDLMLTNMEYTTEDDTIILMIFQLVSALSKDKEEQIRFYAVKCLIQLTHSKYSNTVLKQLSSIMDTGTSIIKLSIIARVKEIKSDDVNNAIIEYIIQKGRVDNNYWVREIAFRSDGSHINQP